MAASTVITIDWASFSRADLVNKFLRTDKRDTAKLLQAMFIRMAAGVARGTMRVQMAATAQAKAANTFTYDYTSLDVDDTLTIGTEVLTAKASGNGTTQWTIGATNALGTASLMATINANTTLSKFFIATNPTETTVVITALLPGAIYNMIACTSSDTGGLAPTDTTLVGGTGGDNANVSTFAFGV